MENILVKCPHCSNLIIINKKDFNRKIFRHGVCKKDKQIDPHSNKEECDKLIKENLINGCGKQFKLIIDLEENKYCAEKSDYI